MGEEFSIVIPCKNESLYIEKLLLSIVGQSVYSPEVPIIVADDQSTDGTLDIINKCKQEHAMNLKVVAGGYPAIARNNGAQIASGKYLIFLDADVELGEINFLEKVLSLAREQNLFCVSSYIQCPDGNILDYLFWKIHGLSLDLYKISGPFSAGMFMLFEREYFLSQGGFDENLVLGEDFELSHKVPKDKFGVVSSFIKITNRRFKQDGYFSTIYKYIRIAASKRYRYSDHVDYFEKSSPKHSTK